MRSDGQKAPTALYGPFGTTYHPDEEAKVITDYLENHER
jgi:hypothetical protein